MKRPLKRHELKTEALDALELKLRQFVGVAEAADDFVHRAQTLGKALVLVLPMPSMLQSRAMSALRRLGTVITWYSNRTKTHARAGGLDAAAAGLCARAGAGANAAGAGVPDLSLSLSLSFPLPPPPGPSLYLSLRLPARSCGCSGCQFRGSGDVRAHAHGCYYTGARSGQRARGVLTAPAAHPHHARLDRLVAPRRQMGPCGPEFLARPAELRLYT